MRVFYHPDFPKDIKRFEAQYSKISEKLALRFRSDVDRAIDRIKMSPGSAGHFLNTGSKIVNEVRRCNLACFPFFLLLWHLWRQARFSSTHSEFIRSLDVAGATSLGRPRRLGRAE